LKYVNILSAEKHFVGQVSDLALSISVSGSSLQAPVNLNYLREAGPDHHALVRISSPQFVTGPAAATLAALIEIDVATPTEYKTSSADSALEWAEIAHRILKQEFFALLPDDVLGKLESANGKH
jgi:hypothetical protein